MSLVVLFLSLCAEFFIFLSPAQAHITLGPQLQFIDEQGQQVILRGMNVSGSTKHVSKGFLPFVNMKDARNSLQMLKERTGANIIRLPIAWEGVHPAVDVIDYHYLQRVAQIIEVASSLNIYVLLDFHQDLFSRHLFKEDAKHSGNGAPAWVTEEMNGEGSCGIICFHWSQNNITNKIVKQAYRQFWANDKIKTDRGERRIQDEYLWQMGESLKYLKQYLSSNSWDKIVGVDPFNEPIDGGRQGLSIDQWEQEKLWPFYQKIDHLLVQNQLSELLLFAEPLTFWNVNLGFPFASSPSKGDKIDLNLRLNHLVFNAHFYDAKRQGPVVLKEVANGEYFADFKKIRDRAETMQSGVFVSEFGAPLQLTGKKAPEPILRAMFQGLDTQQDGQRLSLLAAPLSFTQWHWDIYNGQHSEVGPHGDILSADDAWNGEHFSVLKNEKGEYNLPRSLVERPAPLKTSGQLKHFVANLYNDDKEKNFYALWNSLSEEKQFSTNKFFFAALDPSKKGHSSVHAQFFLPAHYDLSKTVVITNDRIWQGKAISLVCQFNAYGACVMSLEINGERPFVLVLELQEGQIFDGKNWQLMVQTDLKNQLSPIVLQ